MAPAGANVIVAGGGIAGMTAALRLAERGCEVTIYEAKEVLGGNLASGLKAGMVRPLVFEAPEFDVYPHMYQAWYLNFWDLLEDAGVSIEREGTELRSVEGFTPFSSFHQLRRRDEFRRPQEKGLQRLATLTHPYSAGCMLQNLASGVAPPADMFTFGYAGVDLQAEVMNPTVRLQNMSLTGYLNSRRYLSKAAIDAYETFITTVWGLPAYLVSAGDYRTYAAYCYGAAEEDSWLTRDSAAEAFIDRLEKRLTDKKVKIKRQTRVAGVTCESASSGPGSKSGRVLTVTLEKTELDWESEEWVAAKKPEIENLDAKDLDVVLAVPPKPLAWLVRAADPGARVTDSLPPLRELARVQSERMPMLHLVFNDKLELEGEDIPREPVSLAGSELRLAFTDISQTWTGLTFGDQTVLAVSCSEPSLLPAEPPAPAAKPSPKPGKTSAPAGTPSASPREASPLPDWRNENARAMVAELKEYLEFDDADVDWNGTRYRENRDVQLSLNAIGTDTWRPQAHFSELKNLYFAGDFCKNDFGITTVEAAVATGLAAANAVIKKRKLGKELKIKEPGKLPAADFLAIRYAWLPLAYAARAVAGAGEHAGGGPGKPEASMLRYLLTPGLRPEPKPGSKS